MYICIGSYADRLHLNYVIMYYYKILLGVTIIFRVSGLIER